MLKSVIFKCNNDDFAFQSIDTYRLTVDESTPRGTVLPETFQATGGSIVYIMPAGPIDALNGEPTFTQNTEYVILQDRQFWLSP